MDDDQEAKGDTHTTYNIKEDLTDVLHFHQQLERIQPFLDNDVKGMPFVCVVPTSELGILKQMCDRLEG